MKCPRDTVEMNTSTYEGIEIDTCPICSGVWLDRGELEVIEEVHPEHPKIEAADPVAQAYERARQEGSDPVICPFCSEEMVREERGLASGVMIDVCPKNHGIWLDKGELQSLERFYERERVAARNEGGVLGSLRMMLGW